MTERAGPRSRPGGGRSGRLERLGRLESLGRLGRLVRLGRLRGLATEELGSDIVEFALTLPILFLVVFGTIEVCLALYTGHFVANGAREATRYAAVRGSSWSGAGCTTVQTVSCSATATDVQNFVQSLVPSGLQLSRLTVTTTWPGKTATGTACSTTNDPGCLVVVQLSYAFPFSGAFLSTQIFTLTSQSKTTVLQ